MKTSDPSFVEIASLAGFDFVILDYEHGVVSHENMQNLIRAAYLGNTLPIIRVAEINESNIGKALDIGAAGIQVPQVTSKEDAIKIIELSKFHPMGNRGVCRFVRAANYSLMPQKEYYENANKSAVIIQLEGKKALENIDEILGVKGIDVVFIGPYDLSQSLGVPGDIFNDKVVKEMKAIVNKCKQKNMLVGTFVDTKEGLDFWKGLGVQYIAYSVDVGIFAEKCKEIIGNAERQGRDTLEKD
ncbi:4-hydroxy-2-oxoheptanedioate aldolase [Limnospira platensis C1]|nr:4-hydroxy-2-oxoheptanedioate aldolase [Arthrospira platensis C1]